MTWKQRAAAQNKRVVAMDVMFEPLRRDEELGAPYHMDGDPCLDDPEPRRQRVRNKLHPAVRDGIAAIGALLRWDAASLRLSRDEYARLHRAMTTALRGEPDGNEGLSESQYMELQAKDWEQDSGRRPFDSVTVERDILRFVTPAATTTRSGAASSPRAPASASSPASAQHDDLMLGAAAEDEDDTAGEGLSYAQFYAALFQTVDIWTMTTAAGEYAEFLETLHDRISRNLPPA